MAAIITSVIMILSIFFLLPLLYFLPKVSLPSRSWSEAEWIGCPCGNRRSGRVCQ
jgi:hypothetical protein